MSMGTYFFWAAPHFFNLPLCKRMNPWHVSNSEKEGKYASVRWFKSTKDIHATLILIIQVLRLALPSQSKDTPLVASSPDKPIYSLLTCRQSSAQKLPLRREIPS